jgi:release factor glutamine methyltransferase
VYALDISKEALQTARENALMNNAKVELIEFDIISPVEDKQNSPYLGQAKLITHNLDIIVSNPPYVRESEKKQMHANVLDHEPYTALFVKDEDPLIFYEKIILFAKEHLTNGGKCYFEINEKFGEKIAELFLKNNFSDVRVIKDLQDKYRMAVGVWKL